MVAHWRRTRGPHSVHSLILNAIGATTTACTLVIIIISKFTAGAWITILVIPPLVLLFLQIRRYHSKLDHEIDTGAGGPIDAAELQPPVVVIPLKRLNRVA